jgi:hypothetical protein
MRKLLDFIFRGFITIIFGTIIAYCLLLLSLFMWDSRFIEKHEDIMSYLWDDRKHI